MHILELDRALVTDERLRARLVLHLWRLAQEVEHRLDVHQRLLELAVNHAHEVEGLIKLNKNRVDQHEVANRHGSVRVCRGPRTASRAPCQS